MEYLTQTSEFIELIARPAYGKARGLNRFRVFSTPLEASAAEKRRFIKKAYNTLVAVTQIGSHPHIHRVWMVGNDYGDIIEGSEWSVTGTLRDLLNTQKEVLPMETAISICHGIAMALAAAHQVGLIHRAVKPENILMVNGVPELMNFDLAYQVEDDRVTVISDIAQLRDDGYIAPEVLAGGDIDEGTDYFGMGVIAFELLTGFKPFSSVRRFVAEGGTLDQQDFQRLQKPEISSRLREIIPGMLHGERNGRLKDSDEILKAFGGSKPPPAGAIEPVNDVLSPGTIHSVYEIEELIDRGSEAQIYKAITKRYRAGAVREEHLAIKLFNREISRERILREAAVANAVNSAYVVHGENYGYWNNQRYFLVLDYIDGESLRTVIERGERPDYKQFHSIALCLMEAVKAFHRHTDEEGHNETILHSDIKPDNIMVTKDNRAVLVDFGLAGEPRVDIFQGTPGYVPPDSIRGADMEFTEGGDLFALGVSLWEWLFGEKPYENPALGMTPRIPIDNHAGIPAGLRSWLLRAVATRAQERFSSIEEMYEDFIGEVNRTDGEVPLPGKHDLADQPDISSLQPPFPALIESSGRVPGLARNPFVAYLNSLSNISAQNENATAEYQIINPFFSRIFVNNPLADYIHNEFFINRRNVIVTGNAGDGKTTIAADIFRRLGGKPRALQKMESIAGGYVIVKDMSELKAGERQNILTAAAMGDENKTWLIISNTGTLLESFRALAGKEMNLSESLVLEALQSDAPVGLLGGRFLLVNIARMDSIDTALAVFQRMMEEENWDVCTRCEISDCPIYTNIGLLRAKPGLVAERAGLVYRRLYGYGTRLTMRQMTGHLAYSITAGRECSAILGMSRLAREECLPGSLFFNRFFGDDGSAVPPETMQMLPVREIRRCGFGLILDPNFEHKAWSRQGSEVFQEEALKKAWQSLRPGSQRINESLRRQIRRLIFFLHPLADKAGHHYIGVFLNSPTILKILEYTRGKAEIPALQENRYRSIILQVLQEFFTGVRLPEGNWQPSELLITLNSSRGSTGTQMVLAEFRSDDFELFIKPRYTVSAGSGGLLCLNYKPGGIQMDLDLPFLDYVLRRYGGEVAEELSAYYSNRLERFKVELLSCYQIQAGENEAYIRLVRMGAERRFVVRKILISDHGLEVL